MSKYYYTDKQYTQLKNQIVILHANNEQKNEHILEWFDKKHIAHQGRALKTGDYCFMIKADPELGFLKDTYFTDELCIERKNSLGELAGSINDNTFHNEIKRMLNIKHKYLLIEGDNWEKILSHDYRSDYMPASFWNTLHTFMTKYDLKIIFCEKATMGQMIYSICKSVLEREILR